MTRSLLCFALLAAPPWARAELSAASVELHGGVDLLRAVSEKYSGDVERLTDIAAHAGITGLARFGRTAVGAIAEASRQGGVTSSAAAGLLGGLEHDAGGYRLQLLGEAGAHRLGGYVTALDRLIYAEPHPPSSVWLAYIGVRPGISRRPAAGVPLSVGLWAFLRVDVTARDLHFYGRPGSSYTAGGYQAGFALRLGWAM